MIDPTANITANYNRTLVTVRVSAINSPDWTDIVGTRIELSHNMNFTTLLDSNSTTHYKVRAYLENPAPNRRVYARVTLTKNDNTTHQYTFSFMTPFPLLGMIKDENGTKYISSVRKMDKNGNLTPRNYTNKALVAMPAHIDIMADEAGEMVLSCQWQNAMWVENVTQGTERVEVLAGHSTSVSVNVGDIVMVSEVSSGDFRRFMGNNLPLCSGVSAHIVLMPPMNKFTTDEAGTTVGDNFFRSFNQNGTLTSLPEGSFDIHKIVRSSNNNSPASLFFYQFNNSGALTSLPEGSFDTSNIVGGTNNSLLGSYFFEGFNAYGALTSLPEGSFDFENVTKFNVQTAFSNFNRNGALTTLPAGSFGFSSLSDYNNFPRFAAFNSYGRLATLPAGAFHFKNGAYNASGTDTFKSFNYNGSLTSLPDYSFNFEIDTAAGTGLFYYFNALGALTSLPAGSFRIKSTATIMQNNCFTNFNTGGALTSLPAGSFNTDNITQMKNSVFSSFNNESGALTSLPEGSFNFDNVTSVGDYVIQSFNQNGGALKTLPKGSFSFSSLTTIGKYFAHWFNANGNLEYLPINSFSVSSVTGISTVSINEQAFATFNQGGKLTESLTDYNPEFIYPTPYSVSSITSNTADYYDKTTQTWYQHIISAGSQFKYYEADYFTVTYTPSAAYTTDVENTYLSGQTITFSAAAIDPEYVATPTITTAGGVTVSVTDNGDDTYTFIMPQDDIDVAFAVSLRPAVITLVAEEAGTMQIANKWTTPIIVKNVTQGTSPVTVTSSATTSLPVDLDDEITVTESSGNTTFRNWANYSMGFATGTLCHISEMPPMNRFTITSEGTGAKAYFFYYFCAGVNGKGITSLPADSFDTSTITGITGNYFFSDFNANGLLTSLPAGSFDISNITRVNSTNFFDYFNYNGKLTSLPTGSFDTSNITTLQGGHFFDYFNSKGELTSLPAGSFDISGIGGNTGEYFFTGFNSQGKLTSLPVGSFDTSNITNAGTEFFASFNYQGKLTSLPVGSFNTSNITTQYRRFFQSFNESGELTSLPDGSFDISGLSDLSPSSSSGSGFFQNFNRNGKLTSLPAGSFDTSNITSIGEFGFNGFNYQGKLTSLPIGSFDISNIAVERGGFFSGFNYSGELTSLPDGSFRLSSNLTSTSNNFFGSFNGGTSSARGKLTSLPAGSFDTSHITNAWIGFFPYFNSYGNLTSLPTGSFNTSNITGEVGSEFFYKFNRYGALTSLPVGSFDTSNITRASSNFFAEFNYHGALISLPAGSFNISNLTRAWSNFFASFNYKGEITALPAGSFNTRNITTFYPNPSPLFSQFNANGGKLEKDTINYNPDFINPDAPDITAYYWNAQSQASSSSTIVQGAPFYYKTI